jgi:hypothetical protein
VYFVEPAAPSGTVPSARLEAATGAALGARRGEYAQPGNMATGALRPNSVTVQVTIREPGILVINQNYHSAWWTDRGELFDRDGLIALRLHETGTYTVHLRYLPPSFVVGLAVSVLSIAGWVLACWTFGARWLERFVEGERSLRRGGCP